MNTVTLNIGGMTCGGCVKSATQALENVSGVHKVLVSLANNNAEVSFDPAKTSVDALIEAVEDCGFDCTAA